MSVYRDTSRGTIQWRYRRTVKLNAIDSVRISGTPQINTKAEAEKAERLHIERTLNPPPEEIAKPIVMTLSEWFDGRFWKEWVIGQENRKGTQGEKLSAFNHHIRPSLGEKPLDQIDKATIQQFKAELIAKAGRTKKPLSPKTRNNILAVLSKALRYAEEAGVLTTAPRVRLGKVEKPEVECLELEEYARMAVAARKDSPAMLVSVLLAGEAGLRIGEVLALAWEDLDLIAGTITVARQIRQGIEGPTKGGRARKVPMTPTLYEELVKLAQIRRGRVVCAADGKPLSEARAKPHGVYRVCRLAGLTERGWHVMRHSFATHAAQFGVNPWRLQAWLGHSTISQTMRYVHHAEQHRRPLPPEVLAAGVGIADPDDRILAMLGARSLCQPAANGDDRSDRSASSKGILVHATGFEPVLTRFRPRR